MRRAVTADQVGRAAADTIAFRACLHRADQFGVIGESQIVIAAERQQTPPVNADLWTLRPLQHTARSVQILALELFERGVQISGCGHGG